MGPIWNALAWQGFGLRSRRFPRREIALEAKPLDSQLSGEEEQAKAATGRRTPKLGLQSWGFGQ